MLNGGSGADTLAGGLGNDVLSGGSGIDTASYVGELDALFVSLAAGTARRGSAVAVVEDTLASIENVASGAGDDGITGSTAANRIDAGGGDDIITGGGGGNDELIGGLGDDTFNYAFGDGVDTIDGGEDQDTLAIVWHDR